jgi:hypothetical protein
MSLQQAATGKPDRRKSVIIALSDRARGHFDVLPCFTDRLVGAHGVG